MYILSLEILFCVPTKDPKKIFSATYSTVYILHIYIITYRTGYIFKFIVINVGELKAYYVLLLFFTAELELWHFHVAAIQYNFPSRPQIKDFLLSTEFNSEEDNYRLSLQREPPANRSQSAS